MNSFQWFRCAFALPIARAEEMMQITDHAEFLTHSHNESGVFVLT